MVVFGVSVFSSIAPSTSPTNSLAVTPLALFAPGLQPASEAYRESLDIPAHSFFFLARWQWYEWVGILRALALLAGYKELLGNAIGDVWKPDLCTYRLWSGILCAALVITCRRVWRRGYFCSLCARCIFSIFSSSYYRRNAGGICASPARLAMAGSVLAALRGDVLRASVRLFQQVHTWNGRSRPANYWLQAFDWIRENTRKTPTLHSTRIT